MRHLFIALIIVVSACSFEVGAQANKAAFTLNRNNVGASLHGVAASGLNFKDFNFTNAQLVKVDFRVIQAQDARFREANASDADFRGAFMKNADWTAAKVINANFSGAKLGHATFRFADLQGTSFWGADLTRTDFTESNLKGSDLRNAILFYTSFKKAKYDKTTQFSDSFPESLKAEMIFEP